MTIESAISVSSAFGQYDKNLALFEIAKAISGFNNYRIIDSYSSASTPTRYQGDPIANSIWVTSADVGAYNSWFVFEPTNPVVAPASSHPRWQAKLQSKNRFGDAWDDPSGEDYNFEGQTDFHTVCIRFSPFGGWNPVTFDFDDGVNPQTQVTYNFKIRHYNNSVHTNRFLLTCDEDTMLGFVNVLDPANYHLDLMFYLGEYVPKSLTQGTPSRLAILRDGSFNIDDFTTGAFPHGTSTAENLFLLDNDDELLSGANAWSYQTTADFSYLITRESQPNRFDSNKSLDLFPVMIRVTSPDIGIIGSLRGIFRSYGAGRLALIDGKDLVTSNYGYGHAFMWDENVSPA